LSLDENAAGGNAPMDLPDVVALPSPVCAVRLWWCTLAATRPQLRSCADVLSAGEHARAARFGNPRLRDRYLIGRAALRKVLGETLGLAPAGVPIVRGTRGRPRLDTDSALDFNVSHTHDAALLGVIDGTTGARIGVDVERRDRRINVTGIARKFLADKERQALATQDEECARRSVLTLWTCKEAMSKATGDALSAPFASIDVDLTDGRRLRDGPGKYQPGAWSLHPACVPDDYIATIAIWRR
jgi:4'-phosphopantetheinyl transferase